MSIAIEEADKNGLSIPIALKMFEQESGWDQYAVSHSCAFGPAQMIQSTADMWHVNPWDPPAAIATAVKKVATWIHQYQAQGRSKLEATQIALSKYNSGNPHAYKNSNFAGGQTHDYAQSIVLNAEALKRKVADSVPVPGEG